MCEGVGSQGPGCGAAQSLAERRRLGVGQQAQQLLRQPGRQAADMSQVVLRRAALRPRERGPLPQQLAQHAVDQPDQALQAEGARQLDAGIDGGVIGDPVELQQLVGAEAQQTPGRGLEARQRLATDLREGKVEATLQAQHPVHQLGQQPAVAWVELPVSGEKAVQEYIGVAAGFDPLEDVVGGPAGISARISRCHTIPSVPKKMASTIAYCGP